MNDSTSAELQPGLILRGPRPRLADFRLAVFDMDSTLIAIECIDEIAALAGKGEQVAAITEAAMRGEITDFRESLSRRLALLEGQPESLLQRVLSERLRFMPGARELCAALKAAGLRLALVSGGFTFFSDYVARELGMDAVRANQLELRDGRLTGRVTLQDWGDVVDGAEKRRFLLAQGPGLPYALRPGARALIIAPGGGIDIARALASGSTDVVAVESNSIIANTIMRDEFADASRRIYQRPEVHVVTGDPRNFVRGTTRRFEVVQATQLGTSAATAAPGALSFAENNLLTVDAFREYLRGIKL